MAIYSKFLALSTGFDRTVDLSTNTLSLGAMQLNGSVSGTLTHKAAGTTTSYTLTWPNAVAAGSAYNLQSDNTGALSWVLSTSGANTALSNLASVAINTSLLPGADNSINLGSASFSWANASIHSLLAASGTSVDVYGRALKDTASATQLSWSTSGVTITALAANVPAAGFKLTGLGAGTTAGDSVRYEQAILASGVNAWTGNQALGGNIITGSGTPVNPGDLTPKSYVDAVANSLSWHPAVLVATTANITLSGEQTIDGFTTSASRVLVKNQTTQANNGIYVSAAGAWSRAADMNSWSQVPAAAVFVQEGTVNADIGFVCTSAPGGTLGTTAITFVQFSSAGAYTADGTTLQLISGTFSIKNGGVTETQINSSTFSASGAITGGSGTKVAWVPDNSSLEISSNAGRIKTTAYDQATITGGGGSAAAVQNSPALSRSLVAGQTFTANTSYAVRWGLTANGETAGRVYAADITTSSFDLFYVIGMASSAAGVSAGGNITVVQRGDFALSSSDTAFASNTDGTPVFLTASGTFSVTAPSTSGQAVTRIGIVKVRSATVTSNIIDVDPVPVCVA